MENKEKKWYKKPMWIYVLSFVFFPVGLYLLWTNQEIAKKIKIIVTCCVGVFVLITGQGGDKKSSSSSSEVDGMEKCCCEFKSKSRYGKICYEYQSVKYCKDYLEGRVHSVDWGVNKGILNGDCK